MIGASVTAAAVACLVGAVAPEGPPPPAVLGIVPGRTEIADAMRTLGPAERFRNEEGTVCYCYASARPGDATVLVLESDAAGGYGLSVTGYALRLAAHDDVERSVCHSTDRVSRSVVLSNGLRLGMSRSDIRAALGKPSRTTPETLHYEWEWVAAASGKAYTVTQRVILHFHKDELTSVHVERYEMT